MRAQRPQRVVEAHGHLIDSQILERIFELVLEHGARYEVLSFEIGRTNEEPSHLVLRLEAEREPALEQLVAHLLPLGCAPSAEQDCRLVPADMDGAAPEGFYSTTNQRTEVRVGGRWLAVLRQRMDAAIVVRDGRAECRKLRDLRLGERVVCGQEGLRVHPEFRERDRHGFAFMASEVSSERRVELRIAAVARLVREVRAREGRVVVVAGPVVIHTGGGRHLAALVRAGWIDVLLANNALAVHDVEQALYGTSLGVDVEAGAPVEHGHEHHMRAINAIRRAGSLRAAVESGLVTRGVVHDCIRAGVELVLAGSIRDDGPLPDTLMDLVEAQDRYAAALEGAELVLMLSTMLHSIGVGNMLPAWVKVVCVDIHPAVVTKLADRGSAQTLGLVTDVGLFLAQLARELGAEPAR
jgi:lysine-ketoglutarate reductase/saccharopine dehydrogenase-like protein (TIGR00300 family)